MTSESRATTLPAAPTIRTPLPFTAYACIVAAWLATRALAVLSIDMTPWMLHDLEVYTGWLPALSSGAFPVDDPTWQYPPGASLVFLGADLGSIDFRWSFTVLVLLVDAAILTTVLVAHRRTNASSWRGPWVWALAGLIVGPIMLTRFDLVPTLFAVLAVTLVGRPALSGVSAALGFLVKVWPALMLLALPRSGLKKGALSFVVTAVVALAAFALLFDNSLSFLANQRDRGLQVESVAALPYLLHSLLGGEVAFGLQYGSIQVLMNGAELVGTIVTALGLVVFAIIAWWRLRGRLDDVPPGDVALTLMLVSVATSRVYSPQFNTWLVGLIAIALLARASRLSWPAGLVIAASLLTQVVYPWSATQLVHADTVTILVQTVRILLLVVAVALSLLAIGSRRTEGQH